MVNIITLLTIHKFIHRAPPHFFAMDTSSKEISLTMDFSTNDTPNFIQNTDILIRRCWIIYLSSPPRIHAAKSPKKQSKQKRTPSDCF